MTLVERLRHKISPLEDKEFTAKILPRWKETDFGPYVRRYKGAECVVLTPGEAWRLAVGDTTEPTLHDTAVMGRSLQALLWERSYLKGNLVFSKPCKEVFEDGF